MRRQLITLVPTEGKTPEQVARELAANLEKYRQAQQKQPAKPGSGAD